MRQNLSSDKLCCKAQANEYKCGAHQDKDSKLVDNFGAKDS